MLWFRQLVAGISLRIPGFDPGAIHVKFMVDWALGQVFLRVMRFSFVSIILPMLHTHLHLQAARTRRTNERSLGTLKKECSFGFRGAMNRKFLAHLPVCLTTIFIAV